MKSTFNILSCLAFFLLVKSEVIGQTLISMNPDYFYITSDYDTLPEFSAFRGMGQLATDSQDTIFLKWEITGWENCPEAWRYTLADTYSSYPFGTTSNIDSANSILVPMPLWGDLPYHEFYFEVYPDQVPGCCRIEVLFSLVENPDSILEVATFDYAILDSTCFVSSGDEIYEQGQVLVYPNPANSAFQILTNEAVTAATLYDLTGNLVLKMDYVPKSSIETTSIPSGLYLLRLEYLNNEISWQRLVVQHH